MNFTSVRILFALFSLGCFAQAATITSFSPTYGSFGETISLVGSGFVFPPGTNRVRFGNVVSHNTFAGSSANLTAKVPAGLTVGSLVKISVSVNGGTYVAHNDDFRVINSGPHVASLDPISGDAGTVVSIM
jgi:hypothetical protein